MVCLLQVGLFASSQTIAQNVHDSIPEVDCEKVFALATEMPIYPSGNDALIADVSSILSRLSCKVPSAKTLVFVITAEGKMKSPRFFPGDLISCSLELEREFEGLPRWIPAKQSGKPVCVQVDIPIKSN